MRRLFLLTMLVIVIAGTAVFVQRPRHDRQQNIHDTSHRSGFGYHVNITLSQDAWYCCGHPKAFYPKMEETGDEISGQD